MTPACATPDIVAHYEMLRAAALGEALPVMARSGLILFLRRGMWGWVQARTAAASCASPAGEPVVSSAAAFSLSGRHGAVVHVLAAIAMSIHHGRSL